MFSVDYTWMHGVHPFHYYTPPWDLCNGLSSDQSNNFIQKLRREEGDMATYHFMVHKIVCISYYKVMFMIHHS